MTQISKITQMTKFTKMTWITKMTKNYQNDSSDQNDLNDSNDPNDPELIIAQISLLKCWPGLIIYKEVWMTKWLACLERLVICPSDILHKLLLGWLPSYWSLLWSFEEVADTLQSDLNDLNDPISYTFL